MIRTILLGAMVLISLQSLAQNLVAYREAPLMGGGPYFLNGTAILEEFANGSFQFRLSNNYATNTGPDVQIYLTNNSTFSSPINLANTFFVEDVGTESGPNQPGISHFSGPYTKALPALDSLNQFDHVVFVCVRFGQLHWGNGSFGSTVTVCANTNSTITAASCDSYTAPSGAVYTMSGTYQDTIANAGGCDSVITVNLTIDAVDASASNNGNVLSANMANATYQWIDCNNGNASIPGASSQTFTPSGDGSYAVIVTNGSCSDTSACLAVSLTNLGENNFAREFKLFPNPATDVAVVGLEALLDQGPVRLEVFDLSGTRVFEMEQTVGDEVYIDLNKMEAGMYFVAVQSATGRQVKRLIKQ